MTTEYHLFNKQHTCIPFGQFRYVSTYNEYIHTAHINYKGCRNLVITKDSFSHRIFFLSKNLPRFHSEGLIVCVSLCGCVRVCVCFERWAGTMLTRLLSIFAWFNAIVYINVYHCPERYMYYIKDFLGNT